MRSGGEIEAVATRLAQAKMLCTLGLALVPVYPLSKLPYSTLLPTDPAGNPTWSKLAMSPATLVEVERWFDHDPMLNIGFITGEASGGICAIDIDQRPQGHVHLPPTVAVHASQYGHHWYKNNTPVGSRLLTSGGRPYGELKGEGTYLLSPPSIHPSGKPYAFADFCAPFEHEITQLPEHFLDQGSVRAGCPHKKKYLEHRMADVSRSVIGSERRDTLIPQWLCCEDVALAIIERLGASAVRLGKAFRCPLPGHTERSPSAALHRLPDGTIWFHDFHGRSERTWFHLGEVYAAAITGKVLDLLPGERAAWFLRSLLDLGFVPHPELIVTLPPEGMGVDALLVFHGLVLLAKVRHLYDPTQVDIPYSIRFASEWCGVTIWRARKALEQLRESGYILRVTQGDRLKSDVYAFPEGLRSIYPPPPTMPELFMEAGEIR